MPEIDIGRGLVTLVDDDDLLLVGNGRWWPHRSAQVAERYYAFRTSAPRPDGKRVSEFMHRVIMGVVSGQFVDHINGDGLDNRRSNLRLATRSQNNANSSQKNRLGFRGVYINDGRYRAMITNGRLQRDGGAKQIHLGYFKSIEDAARAYDDAAIKLFGEFARLNFPPTKEAA